MFAVVAYKERFRDLQNYTTLKHPLGMAQEITGFRDLQNYTTLKRATYLF